MKSSNNLTFHIDAIVIYLVLFYSTCLFADIYKVTCDVDLDDQLNIKIVTDSIKTIAYYQQYSFS